MGGQFCPVKLFRELNQRFVAALLDVPNDFSSTLLNARIKQTGGGDELVQFAGEAGIRVSDYIHRREDRGIGPEMSKTVDCMLVKPVSFF